MSLSPILPQIANLSLDAPQPVSGADKGFGDILDASITRARDDAPAAAASNRSQSDTEISVKAPETAAPEKAQTSSDRSGGAAVSDAPDTRDAGGQPDKASGDSSSVVRSSSSGRRELAASDDDDTAAAPEGNTIADPQTQPDQAAPGQTIQIDNGQPEAAPRDDANAAPDEQQPATTKSLPAQADPPPMAALLDAQALVDAPGLADAQSFAESVVNGTFFPGQLGLDLKATLAPLGPRAPLRASLAGLQDLLAGLDISAAPPAGANAGQASASQASIGQTSAGQINVGNTTGNGQAAAAKVLAAIAGMPLANLLTGLGFGQILTQGTVSVPVQVAPAAAIVPEATGIMPAAGLTPEAAGITPEAAGILTTAASTPAVPEGAATEAAIATQNTRPLDFSHEDLGLRRDKGGLRFAGNRFALAGQANIRAHLATQANEPGQPSMIATKAAISPAGLAPGPFDEVGLPPPATPQIDAASIIDRLSGIAPNPTSPAAAPAAEAGTEVLQALFDRFAPSSPGAVANPNGIQAQQSNALNMTALSAMAIRHSLLTASPAEQIVIQISRAFQAGTNKFSIRLHPAELGRVEVSMEVANDGRVTAIVTAERQETLDLLQRDSRSLERALQNSGLKADAGSLNFSLRDGGEGEDSTGDEGKSAAASLADDGFATGTADPAEDEIVLALNRLGALHALDITI